MIIQVALDLPLRKLFDYSCDASQPAPLIGSRVLVPLASAERVGIVMQHAESTTVPEDKLRSINSILTDLPPLDKDLVTFLLQAAFHSQLPIGKLVFAALPPPARRRLKATQPAPPARNKVPPELPPVQAENFIGVARNTVNETKAALSQGFAVQLLSGMPGTGKTDIAMAMIATCIGLSKTSLVLAPSIAEVQTIATQLTERLLGCNVTIYHSELTPAEQLTVMRAAGAGAVHVIVGTRSALFAPLIELGLIWVVNENDPLHRAERGLQYSARDLAAVRGRVNDCLVLMTAATPSVELRHAAQQNRLHMTMLPKPELSKAPQVEIIDIGGRRLFGGISVEMENAIRRELGRKGLTVVLINRRGRGGIVYCRECRYMLLCPSCNHKLAQDQQGVCLCRQCGFSRTQPETCPGCGGKQLDAFRAGSTRIAETLSSRMPEARVVRADTDSDDEALRDKLASGAVDVVVGTNLLVGMGLQPGTVIISDADSTLHGRNYRAAELLLDTVTKLTYRSPNAFLVIQTRFTKHHLFDALQRGSYETFSFGELAERKAAGLPPFRRLALFSATGLDETTLAQFVGAARQLAVKQQQRKVSLLEAMASKTSDSRFSMQLLVTAPNRAMLLQMLKLWLPQLEQQKTSTGIAWNVEVDPEIW